MCGIAITFRAPSDAYVRVMTEAIASRGLPGMIYHYQIDDLRVGFSHLPITDSKAHNQPFVVGRLHIWLNGYISNWRELVERYDILMETECDTELLVKLIHAQGWNETTLRQLNGFFAIVMYDSERKTLHTITDRFGIKQLYGIKKDGVLYMCSEVRGLQSVLRLEIDEDGADDWMYSLGVMNQNTIYDGVERVPRLHGVPIEKVQMDYDKACEKLQVLLKQAMARNHQDKLSDGCFLSGGIDSGIIARMINPDYNFSMDYQDENYSEASNIKRNSRGIHMGIICNDKLFNEYIDLTIDALDDPKCGSSYTNYALTELAALVGVSILYSGAGGDELFCGYTHRYDKPINDVIRRTDYPIKMDWKISHEVYDWNFLAGILVVEDRMAGQFAIETRYPFLDNDLVNFVLSLPKEWRLGKKILKDVCGLHPDVVAGKKRGFSNPYMTNKQWAEAVLKRKHKKK